MENTKILLDKIFNLIVKKRLRENIEKIRLNQLSVTKEEYQDIEDKIVNIDNNSYFDSFPVLD